MYKYRGFLWLAKRQNINDFSMKIQSNSTAQFNEIGFNRAIKMCVSCAYLIKSLPSKIQFGLAYLSNLDAIQSNQLKTTEKFMNVIIQITPDHYFTCWYLLK